MSIISSARWLAVVFACAACGKSEQPASVAAPMPSAPAAPVVVKKPVYEEATYKLVLSGEPTYTAGQPAHLKLGLEARGGYHVNQEYPVKVALKAPAAVSFAKPLLARADAASFGEQSATFDVGFTAQPGTHEILADVDFAVCTAETCVPEERTLALSVDVK